MSDTPDLESFERVSVTGQKLKKLAEDANPPRVDDGILSPYREEVLGS